MKYNGVDFNESFWKDQTEEQFIAHESHHGLSLKQLKEAFALMNPVKPSPAVKNKVVKKISKGDDQGA